MPRMIAVPTCGHMQFPMAMNRSYWLVGLLRSNPQGNPNRTVISSADNFRTLVNVPSGFSLRMLGFCRVRVRDGAFHGESLARARCELLHDAPTVFNTDPLGIVGSLRASFHEVPPLHHLGSPTLASNPAQAVLWRTVVAGHHHVMWEFGEVPSGQRDILHGPRVA